MKKPEIKIPDCKRFNGYKPCFPNKLCQEECVKPDAPFGKKILIINLDAMGDVLMTTAQLGPVKRKYPESYVAWVTLKSAAPLLFNNPFIDDIFQWDTESLLIIGEMSFDVVMNADKSRRSAALAMKVKAKEKLGFGLNENGQIIPLNEEASYNFRLGIDDYLKFRINDRTGQDILAETFKLHYDQDEYVLRMTDEEVQHTSWYKRSKGIAETDTVIGFNTGCSDLFPNKKMTIDQHIELIEKLAQHGNIKLLLLGGKEDAEQNEIIYSRATERNPDLAARLFKTPTDEGLRNGIVYENAADIVITGDSYGMHLAIALRKYVLVWFGVSCWSEIDLYGRGEKFISYDDAPSKQILYCSPCWKKVCPHNLECIKLIDLEAIYRKTMEYVETLSHAKRNDRKSRLAGAFDTVSKQR